MTATSEASGIEHKIPRVESCALLAQSDWTMTLEDDLLVLSGGADTLFAFPELGPEDARALLAAWRSGAVDPTALSSAARESVFRLRDLGAVRGEQRPRESVRIGLRFVGSSLGELERELERQGLLVHEHDVDLEVLVRTNGELKDACRSEYESLRSPHLLLDLGFRETISLGPLVFPGETACLGCLVGRIAHTWGDARPPERPAVQRHTALVVSLLALEVERFAAGDFRLVNETVALRLDTLETKRSSVYRLPWCPVCSESEEPVGSIPLPWVAQA